MKDVDYGADDGGAFLSIQAQDFIEDLLNRSE